MPTLAASASARPGQRLNSVAESSVVVPALEVLDSNAATEMQDPVDAKYSNIMHESNFAGDAGSVVTGSDSNHHEPVLHSKELEPGSTCAMPGPESKQEGNSASSAATAVDDSRSNHHDPALHSKDPEYGSNHAAPNPERMQEHSSAGNEAGAQEGSQHPQHLSALHSNGTPEPQSSHAVIDSQATREQDPAGQQQAEASPKELQQGKADVQDPAKSAASLPGSASSQYQTEDAAASEESNDALSPAKSNLTQPDSSELAKQPVLPPDASHVNSIPGTLQI